MLTGITRIWPWRPRRRRSLRQTAVLLMMTMVVVAACPAGRCCGQIGHSLPQDLYSWLVSHHAVISHWELGKGIKRLWNVAHSWCDWLIVMKLCRNSVMARGKLWKVSQQLPNHCCTWDAYNGYVSADQLSSNLSNFSGGVKIKRTPLCEYWSSFQPKKDKHCCIGKTRPFVSAIEENQWWRQSWQLWSFLYCSPSENFTRFIKTSQ